MEEEFEPPPEEMGGVGGPDAGRTECFFSFALSFYFSFLAGRGKRDWHYGSVKMCLCHIRKTRSVIVPWTHIQPCPGHIYSCALDTFYKRVVDTFKYVSLPHLYMEKRQKVLTHFKLLPDSQTIV